MISFVITHPNINPCHLEHRKCTGCPKKDHSFVKAKHLVVMMIGWSVLEWFPLKNGQLPLRERDAFQCRRLSWISYQPTLSFPLFQYITPFFLCFTISALFFFVSLPHATFPLFHNNINLFFCFKLSLDCKFSMIRCHLSEYSSSFYIMILADGNILSYQLSLSNCPPPTQWRNDFWGRIMNY